MLMLQLACRADAKKSQVRNAQRAVDSALVSLVRDNVLYKGYGYFNRVDDTIHSIYTVIVTDI